MLKITLTALLLLAAITSFTDAPRVRAADEPTPATGRVIPITAKRFNFSPAQITLKKGETVTLRLTSEDVTHGFYLKPLKLDETIDAGKTKDVTVTPQVAGTFSAICDHFCGSGHGNMHLTIVVE